MSFWIENSGRFMFALKVKANPFYLEKRNSKSKGKKVWKNLWESMSHEVKKMSDILTDRIPSHWGRESDIITPTPKNTNSEE
jgi:hypothetical protein